MRNVVIYNERPDSALLKRQLLDLVISKGGELTSVYYFISLFHYFRYRAELKQLKLHYVGELKFITVPVFLPERLLLVNFILFELGSYYHRFIASLVLRPGTYYCRSYIATDCCSSKSRKIIFDPRSQFPEECVTRGRISVESRIYRRLKKIEKNLLETSSHVICISGEMMEHFHEIAPLSNCVIIPISGPASARPKMDKAEASGQPWKFIYAGSLDYSFWNDIRVYADICKQIQAEVDAEFTFLTKNDHLDLAQTLSEAGLKHFHFKSVSADKVVFELANADVGIMFMPQLLDSRTRFGVKSVEYMFAGLPILTNVEAGALSNFVIREKVGAVIGADCNVSKAIDEILSNHSCLSNNAFASYDKFFDPETNSQKIAALFEPTV